MAHTPGHTPFWVEDPMANQPFYGFGNSGIFTPNPQMNFSRDYLNNLVSGPGGSPGGPSSWWNQFTGFLGSEGFGNFMNAFDMAGSFYNMREMLGLSKESFRHRKSMDLKNYAATRKDYENTLRRQWEVKRSAYQAHGKDIANSQWGSWDAFRDARQIPA